MNYGRRSMPGIGLFGLLPLCLLVVAGCSEPDAPATPTTPTDGPPPNARMGGPGGGPGGPGGPGGQRRGGPVAANATGAEIYTAKCGCHGPDGKGKRAPALTGVSGDSDESLTKVIHDGKEKMPAFGSQLSDDQIKKVVAFIKAFKA